MKRKKLMVLILEAVFVLALLAGLFLVLSVRSNFQVKPGEVAAENKNQENQDQNDGPISPISGLSCEQGLRRPVAVMLSGDSETRPLSGIGQADIVFEMQVVQGSITRYMAVYVCSSPTQIGSIRSARDDFIPLANGLDAIYAHWGGSHFALDMLKTGIINNLDALPNPSNAFYRQSGIPAPHNGFSSLNRLLGASEKLGYRMEGKFSGYPHLSSVETVERGQEKKVLAIEYPGQFRASYQYDPVANSYLRYRGGIKEIDKNTGKQVAAKNVVIMRAVSAVLEGQYNTVQVTGSGQAEYYFNGRVLGGIWKKDTKDQRGKLFFYDDNGQEIKFVPGAIWVEVADPAIAVSYK